MLVAINFFCRIDAAFGVIERCDMRAERHT